MNAFWSYFWPTVGAGLVVGIIAGAIGLRRRSRRNAAIAIGVVVSVGLAVLWHGPLGGADRFSAEVERGIQETLAYSELSHVTAHLHHGPLTRHVLISGSADDFQRSELALMIGEVPGVSTASWSPDGSGLPLIVQGAAAAVVGFLLGLFVAYLMELRRRYNAQWNW